MNVRAHLLCAITGFGLLAVGADEDRVPSQGTPAMETLQLNDRQFRVDGKARHSCWDYVWTVRDATGKEDNGNGEISFLFAFRDTTNYYRVSIKDDQWSLSRRGGGAETELAAGNTGVALGTPWRKFVLKRRGLHVSGILAGRIVFRAFDDGDGRGTVASWSSPRLQLGKPGYQGVAETEMVFADDFMRTPDEESTGLWETEGGEWKLQSSADEWRGDSPLDPANTTRSPNPFVYRGTGNPQAIALAGLPFWDDLSVSFAVRSQGGKAGLVFSHRGTNDYYVLLWEPTPLWEEPCRFALERVSGGEREVLAETRVRGQREQWYRVGVELRGPAISATLQGTRLLHVRNPTCLGGRFGMLATDGAVDFDAVKVSPSVLRPLEENALRVQLSTTSSGEWQWSEDGASCLVGQPGGEAALVLGQSSWRPGRLAVTVKTAPVCEASIGLCFGVSGEERTLFLWEPATRESAARRLITRSASGRNEVATARGGYAPGQPLRIVADFADDELRIYEAAEGLLLRMRGYAVPRGGVGLVIRDKGKVTFSDLLVNGPEERDWEQPVKTEIFVKDHYMLDWAAPEGDWVPVSSAGTQPFWWHKGDSFGAVELSIPLAAAMEGDGAKALLMAREPTPASGYRVAVQKGKGGGDKLTAELTRQGKTISRVDFTPPAEAETLEVHRDGSFVWLRCGQVEPFFRQLDESTFDGSRLGVFLPSTNYLDGLRLRRDHVVDEQFDEAATNWRKLGRWEVSNKFHCDPRWAFMTGESDGLAALWHLDEFPGDVTFEFYAGMRYRAKYDFPPYYPRPGDINAIIAGGRRGVFDGYSAVISGWETTWTRILKNGEIMAETDQPLVPSTRRMYPSMSDLHRRWFYVKLRRVGPQVELYFDNEKVLSWRDDKPLSGKRIGIWTVDNSILVARAKISYSQRRRFRPAPEPIGKEKEDAPDTQARSVPEPISKCRFTFDRPGELEEWQETGNAGDARIGWDRQDAGSGGGSLRATNVEPGGQFLVPVPVEGLDLRLARRLSFACRLDPDVRVNFYARVAGRHYFIHLTGPEESDENLLCLGRGEVQADGKWHRVDFPIGDALLERRPLDAKLPVESMHFGVHHGGYLRAGLGGNPPGASFNIDDFEILLETNGARIAVASLSPEPKQPWGGEPVGIRFAPGTQPPLWRLALTAGSKPFAVDGTTLKWDRKARALWFDATIAGLVLTNRQSCSFCLADKETGKSLKEWELVFDPSVDSVSPSPVRINEYLVCDTFEHDFGTWKRTGGRHGALLVRDNRVAASGEYSLKLFNELVGGIAGAQITTNTFSAGRYPLLSFDIRLEEEVLTDLLLRARHTNCRVTLTDNGHRNEAYLLGAVTPPIQFDGKWRHVELNLHELLAGHPFVAKAFSVSSVAIGDGGWAGNRQGASYWVDNFKVTPCFSSAGKGFVLSWTSADPGGVAGYSYHWSDLPGEDAERTLDGNAATASFTNLTEGRCWFHIRPVDRAGNWGDTSHWLFLIDNTPPRIAKVFPAPESEDGGPFFGVELADPVSGVDPDSLALTFNGRTLRPGQKGVHMDLAGCVIQVDRVAAGLCTDPVPDGHVFEVVLAPVCDFAGNFGEPSKWKWKFAHSLDKNAPFAPEIVWAGGKMLRHYTFEQAKSVRGTSSTLRRDRYLDRDRGTHVQRVRVCAANTEISAGISGAVDASKYGYVSFRYRFPPGLRIDLTASVKTGEKRSALAVIELTDVRVRPDGVVRAGRVEGIRCDDKWHAATVDLRKHLEACPDLRDREQTNKWEVSSLSLADVGLSRNDVGTTFYLDDVVIADAGPCEAQFAFKAADESGIAGFACAVDRDPEGDPGKEINVPFKGRFTAGFKQKGIWYVHARARDAAGNWSEPGHYTYVAE